MQKAIVLLSGGLDSATCLAIAKKSGFETYALSFSYGQRHEIELKSAKKISKKFGVKEHKIAKIDLRIFGGSALTGQIAVPKDRRVCLKTNCLNSQPILAESQAIISKEYVTIPQKFCEDSQLKEARSEAINASAKFSLKTGSSLSQVNEIPKTYVPARNTIFLSYALSYAEVVGAFDIFIGVNAVDYSGYPDCRPDFIKAFENLSNLATAVGIKNENKFRIHVPLIKMSKAEIIKYGISLGLDYSETHSCYDPIPRNKKFYACGRCDSCQLRLIGFSEAGIDDPINYVHKKASEK